MKTCNGDVISALDLFDITMKLFEESEVFFTSDGKIFNPEKLTKNNQRDSVMFEIDRQFGNVVLSQIAILDGLIDDEHSLCGYVDKNVSGVDVLHIYAGEDEILSCIIQYNHLKITNLYYNGVKILIEGEFGPKNPTTPYFISGYEDE